MADSYKKPEEEHDYATDPDTGKTQSFTKKPGVSDYFKEAFLPTAQRAQLEAIRNARERAQGS